MGRYVFRLPDIGEGIAEAEIVSWHVKVGDRVEEDSRLADVMTGKATVEMESPVSGTVLELGGAAGDVIAIGAPLLVLDVEGEGNGLDGAEAAVAVPPPSADVPQPVRDVPVPAPVPTSRPAAGPRSAGGGKVLASPAVRQRATALGIDLAMLPAGPGGRIGHGELDAWLLSRGAVSSPAPLPLPTPPKAGATAACPAPATVEPTQPVAEPDLEGAGEKVRVIGLRRRIAENMAAAKRHIPHFTYVEECDVTALEDLRAELNTMRALRPRLTMLPLLIRAICAALPDFPMINARYDEAAGVVTRYDAVHLGMAAQTPSGLMVPVIRNAQARDVWDLAAEIGRLAEAARSGSAEPGELAGSTLTITSLGPLGGIATTPVINRPEVAIIGPNRIVERAVFVPDASGGEALAKRKLMNISISCDHRVVDGWDAASFVQAVKRLLEAPMQLLG